MKICNNGVYRDMTPEEEAEYNNSIPNIPQEPTQEDRIEAQVLYTALMTDTLLEEQLCLRKLKRFFDMGLYTKEQVYKFFEKGVITEEEYKSIIEEELAVGGEV